MLFRSAHVSPAASEKKPQGSATSIDVPLSPRTRGAKEELCLETPPAALIQEEESQNLSKENEFSNEDPHVYVPQEIQIPLGEDGQPGPWCSFHQSDRHNVDDC